MRGLLLDAPYSGGLAFSAPTALRPTPHVTDKMSAEGQRIRGCTAVVVTAAANMAEGFLVPNMGGQEGDQTTFIGGFPIRTYPGPIRGRWGL
jgi:hypothetical protein